LFKHPSVHEACVISTQDSYRGESVKAVVVLRMTHRQTTSAEIIAWCREQMSAYKVPRQIQFVQTLPKSASGKVLWRVLQKNER
ncbi:MAG: long-chain fatty acid--CoA ligase, partial [Alcaligenaceae bacterium]